MFFAAGGPGMFEAGVQAGNVTAQQQDFFSSEAFMNQGAPYIAAVLAYALAATGYRRSHRALHGSDQLDRDGLPMLFAACAVLAIGVLSAFAVLADVAG